MSNRELQGLLLLGWSVFLGLQLKFKFMRNNELFIHFLRVLLLFTAERRLYGSNLQTTFQQKLQDASLFLCSLIPTFIPN